MRDEKQLLERYELAIERIRLITLEESVMPKYRDFFQQTAGFILELNTIWNRVRTKATEDCTLEELRKENANIYRDILEEHYKKSYANPDYAVSILGEDMGGVLCLLYAEIRRGIVSAYAGRLDYLTVSNELFIEIYNCFENESEPNLKEIKSILYWYVSDYYDVFVADRLRAQMTAEETTAAGILLNANLADIRYLYQFGEYVSETEERMALYWNGLTEEEVGKKADAAVDSLLEKMDSVAESRVVGMKFQLGTERFIRCVIEKLQAHAIHATILEKGKGLFFGEEPFSEGYVGLEVCQQFDTDHAADIAFIWDKKLMERKLEVVKTSLEQMREMAYRYAGTVSFVKECDRKTKPGAAAITFSEKQLAFYELYKEKENQIISQYTKFNKYLLQEVNTGMVDIPW